MEYRRKKTYNKSNTLYIGEMFNEMYDDEVLSEIRCKVVSNTASLNRAIISEPKIIVLRCMLDGVKNSSILQTVIESCPQAKILVIGGEHKDFKKSITNSIDAYLPYDCGFEAFRTSLEELMFAHNYGEDFSGSDLELDYDNPQMNKYIWIFLGGAIVVSSIALFLFINYI
jgi:DNA-binding NarL/FixJ family response regulator